MYMEKLRTKDYRIGYGYCIPNDNNEDLDIKEGDCPIQLATIREAFWNISA